MQALGIAAAAPRTIPAEVAAPAMPLRQVS
jgi:hypothetical protein